MMSNAPKFTNGSTDAVHMKLRLIVEKRKRASLWVASDAITFVPRLLPIIYGDGRALFTISTINQRPAYWIVRACSTWGCAMDREDAPGPDFGVLTDYILTELEEAFGNGRCGYSGNSLFYPKKERIQNCKCDDCMDGRMRARWPMVDDYGGCSWSRMDWPPEFDTIKNPLSWHGNLLADTL